MGPSDAEPGPSPTPSLVMSNPSAFPDVFVGVLLALDLSPRALETFAGVCTQWRDFVRGYLWRSERVKARVSSKWLSHTPSALESGASDGVRCLAGDGREVLAGMYGGAVEVWPACKTSSNSSRGGEWRRRRIIRRAHNGSVFCLALSRRLAVSGSFDHSVCVWDRLSSAPAPYALVRKMAGLHADMVYGVAVNATGVVLSCSHDSVLCVYKFDRETTTVDHLGYLEGHSSDGIKAVDADEFRAISCGRDRTLRLWCLEKRENAKTDSATVGHLLRLYDLFSGRCLRNLYGHSARVTALAFGGGGGERIVSGDEDGNVLIWDNKSSRINRRGGSRRSLNGSFDSEDGSDLLEDETEAGSDLTPSNVLFTVRGQKVAGFAVCEAKSGKNNNTKTEEEEDWEMVERRTTTAGNGQDPLFYSGIHLALQKGTMIYLDFLESTP